MMCKVDRLNNMVKDYIGEHNKELWENDEKCYIIDFDIIETDGHKQNIIDYVESNYKIYYNNPMFDFWVAIHHNKDDFSKLCSYEKEDIEKYCMLNKIMEGKKLTPLGLELMITNLEEVTAISKKHIESLNPRGHYVVDNEILETILNFDKNASNLHMLIEKISNNS